MSVCGWYLGVRGEGVFNRHPSLLYPFLGPLHQPGFNLESGLSAQGETRVRSRPWSLSTPAVTARPWGLGKKVCDGEGWLSADGSSLFSPNVGPPL